MNRNICYNRFNSDIHVKRKVNIIKHVYGFNNEDSPSYISGKLNKGKIHCSCPMCRSKTKTLGWKYQDLKNIEKCNYDLESYELEEEEKEEDFKYDEYI